MRVPQDLPTTAVPRREALLGVRIGVDLLAYVGPGADAELASLTALAADCRPLGLVPMVEAAAWAEVERDPDVCRRGVDLASLEPIHPVDEFELPSHRDLVARFKPARSESDHVTLRLLGALHARVLDLVISDADPLHELAQSAGFADRVLTVAEARCWIGGLSGRNTATLVRDLDGRTALAEPALAELLDQECGPYDPYLRTELVEQPLRVFVAESGGELAAVAVVTLGNDLLQLRALAQRPGAGGRHVLEPLLAAVLSLARRRAVPLDARLAPHLGIGARLLTALGFERQRRDDHGREVWELRPPRTAPLPQTGASVWLYPLDPEEYAALWPELAGAAQADLFTVDRPRDETLASSLTKTVVLGGVARVPTPGDLLVFFNARSVARTRTQALAAIAQVERVADVDSIEELLPLTALATAAPLATLVEQAQLRPLRALKLRALGRLDRFVPLSSLREAGIVSAAPTVPRRLDAEAWARLAPRLKLA